MPDFCIKHIDKAETVVVVPVGRVVVVAIGNPAIGCVVVPTAPAEHTV